VADVRRRRRLQLSRRHRAQRIDYLFAIAGVQCTTAIVVNSQASTTGRCCSRFV
jgi:hypothetical protein